MKGLAPKCWCLCALTALLWAYCGRDASGQEDGAVPFTSITRAAPGEAQSLEGAGSTFAAPLYKRWFPAYAATIGVKATYDAVGSGEGIKRIINRAVDFAGSDAPMTTEQMPLAKGGEIIHIPTAFGAIAVIYNVPGLSSQLRLTAQNLADIYLGEIRQWNDPRLVRSNPQLAGISQEIIVVHRADGSGSTFSLSDYLSAISPAWQKRSGKSTTVFWPVGIGGRGGDGMVAEVTGNPFAIGYVDYGTAVQQHIPFVQLQNAAGRYVSPSLNSIGAAVSAAGLRGQSDLRFSVVNALSADAYPICTGTWLLAYRNMTDRGKAIALTRLLWWAIHDGQAVNSALNYAPVTAALRARSEVLIKQIAVNGQPAFTGQ